MGRIPYGRRAGPGHDGAHQADLRARPALSRRTASDGVGGVEYGASLWLHVLRRGGAWLVLATGFKLVPTAYDGILEKAAMTATLLWTLSLAWILTTRGYHRLKDRAVAG